MPGPSHRIARWLRLGLTSLALALGAMPAHALPTASDAVVTLSVGRREASKQATAPEAAVHSRPTPTGALQVPARTVSESSIPETRRPGPPRRLFIVHRALLR